MRHQNIQDRKLNIIEQLILTNDDNVLKKVEDIINSSLQIPLFHQFTKEELIKRAIAANEDIKNGEVLSQEEAEKLSKTW
jgi:hypothetical protein